jgi:hypothetical protein
MNKYLFNYAVSYTGGGYKRLYEYLKWFNENGGAYFIINSNVSNLVNEFKNNKFYIVKQSVFQRIFNDCSYLSSIVKENEKFTLYYSYGIPIYKGIAIINWFHLSNVLPLVPMKIKMSFYDSLRFYYIGIRTKIGFKKSDVISAESENSLSLINTKFKSKLFLSVNGGDDEIAYLGNYKPQLKAEIALVIGTHWYKAVEDSYSIFLMLREKDPLLKLVIIGNDKSIPQFIKNDKNVVIINKFIERSSIIDYLKKCKYFISTTLIENSYNSISEGIGFAEESFVSDIGPHRELLRNVNKEEIKIPNNKRIFFHLLQKDVDFTILRSWDSVIVDMIKKVNKLMEKEK